jgi:thymidylate synthase (FAD)
MKIVKPEAHYLGKVPTDYEGALKFIEAAGRTCYRSEDKITPGSAEKFVRKLITAGHLAMVEHSNFVIRAYVVRFEYDAEIVAAVGKYLTFMRQGSICYIGGNLTAWWQYLEYLGYDSIFQPFIEAYGHILPVTFGLVQASKMRFWEPCPFDEIPPVLHRHSVRFVCDRGVSHELVRHRPCSFAQESTRYVNYGIRQMEFIEPTDFEKWPERAIMRFEQSCMDAEYYYTELIDELSPQQARAVLPNALRTEIVVTADAAEWAHIKKLRTAPSAHPDMRRLMSLVPWEEICPAI